MAYLIEKQGCRRATIIFSVIAAVSFLIDVFVNNVYVFYFSLGALAGSHFTVSDLRFPIGWARMTYFKVLPHVKKLKNN